MSTSTIIMREGPFRFQCKHLILVTPEFPDRRDATPHAHAFAFTVDVEATFEDAKGYAFDHALIVGAGERLCDPLISNHARGLLLNQMPGLERGLTEDLLLRYLVPGLRTALDTDCSRVIEVALYQGAEASDVCDLTRSNHVKVWRG